MSHLHHLMNKLSDGRLDFGVAACDPEQSDLPTGYVMTDEHRVNCPDCCKILAAAAPTSLALPHAARDVAAGDHGNPTDPSEPAPAAGKRE